MCGICGRLDFSLTRPFESAALRRWAELMRRRGPDDDGTFTRPGVGLAMRRLSIIDLSGGHQPIGNEDGSVQVVLNGEIYNYRELRSRLEAKGHHLRTRSDTEVIAHLWEDHGIEAFRELRGMFAIAVWDERTKTLAIARDRIGIKPLYVARRRDGLDFASELKLLLALPEVRRDLDPAAIASYFMVGYIPPPETAYRHVEELPPGHWMTWSPSEGVRSAAFWRLHFAPDRTRSEGEWLARLDAAVRDAVESHLVADVPVATFLSGGLDSSAVTAYMCRATAEPPRAFTIRYVGSGSADADESALAAAVARRCGARHEIIDVSPDVTGILDELVDAFDQPMADASAVPTYYLTQATAREVKVALSGLGGDELFGGYERHAALVLSDRLPRPPAWAARAATSLASRALPLLGGGGLAGDRLERFLRAMGEPAAERYLGFVTRMPRPELAALLARADAGGEALRTAGERLRRHFGGDPDAPVLNRGLAMDYGQYLPGDILPLTDRISMWHSLEVRVPFVDHELVELCATVPPELKVRGRTKKYILRRLLRDQLPAQLFEAPKRGFVGPTSAWLRHELRDLLRESLGARDLRESGWVDPRSLDAMLEHHVAGRSDRYGPALWALLMFARWHARQVMGAATLAA